MTSSIQPRSQTHGSDLHRLPIELRYHIYKLVWESRVVLWGTHTSFHFGSKSPGDRYDTPKPPVTLYISHEARQETLRHYYRFSTTARPDRMYGPATNLDSYGYVNPYLDTIHCHPGGGPSGQPLTLTLQFKPRICDNLLRLSLSPDVDISWGLSSLMANFDMSSISTIDFWVRTIRSCFRGNSGHRTVFRTTSRYRLCRTPAPKVPVVKWEEATFRPQHLGNNSWRWQYRPEESSPLSSIPGDVQSCINLQSPASWSKPGALLRVPCAMSNGDEVQARDILKQSGVLLFDADPTNIDPRNMVLTDIDPPLTADSSAPAYRKFFDEGGWSLLKVVDPTRVWDREITSLAFAHLFAFSPLVKEKKEVQNGLGGYGSSIFGSAPKLWWMVSWLPRVGIEWTQLRREFHERAMVISEPVHGICTLDYMYSGNGRSQDSAKYATPQALVTVDQRCPSVSTRSLRESFYGREAVERGEDMLLMVPAHQEILDRRYRVGTDGCQLFVYAE